MRQPQSNNIARIDLPALEIMSPISVQMPVTSEVLFSAVRDALFELAVISSNYRLYDEEKIDKSRVHAVLLKAIRSAQEKAADHPEASLPALVAEELKSLGQECLDVEEADDRMMEEAESLLENPRLLADQIKETALAAGIETLTTSDGNAIARLAGNSGEEDASESVVEWIRDTVLDAVVKADTSSFESLLRECGPVRLVYTALSCPDAALEDDRVQFREDYATAEGVIPNDAFQRYLKFINVSADHYVRAVKGHTGVDLLDPEQSDDAEAWQELCESLQPDLMRPPVITPQQAVEVVENSYTCCVPVLVVDMPVDVLMNLKSEDRILIKGGQIGLHDFMNGAGYLENASGPICITGDLMQWQVEAGSVDEVYGMTEEAYAAEVKVYEPTPQAALPFSGPGQ